MVNFSCVNHDYSSSGGGSASAGGRPWAEVEFTYGAASLRFWCLVDTGADNSMLPYSAARSLGFLPLNLPPAAVHNSSGGHTHYRKAPAVDITFAGMTFPVSAPVLFGSVHVPLLGRSALVAASSKQSVEFGFNDTTWQHT